MKYYGFLRTTSMALFLMAWTNAALIASPASELAEALARYAEKEAAGKGAQALGKEASEAAVAGVAEQVLKDSGEQGLQEVSKLAAKFGPDVIHAVENTPAVAPLLKALESMPEEQLPKAIARLAAGQQGRELAETTVRYGSKALRAELAHPGVGGRLVRALGEEGYALSSTCTTDEAIALGRQMDGLASVPASQRQGLLQLIAKDKDRFFAWLGRFVEANPGKSIASATFLAVFLPNSERILGGDEIVIDKNGIPVVIHKTGIAEAPIQKLAEPVHEGLAWLMRGAAVVLVSAFGVYLAIKLLGVWRRGKHQKSEATSGEA